MDGATVDSIKSPGWKFSFITRVFLHHGQSMAKGPDVQKFQGFGSSLVMGLWETIINKKLINHSCMMLLHESTRFTPR